VRHYVNANEQGDGDHEVHTSMCRHLPDEPNRVYLGDFVTCAPAVVAARQMFHQSNGCAHCSNARHAR
jgi:hypothetical protein